MTLKVLIIPNAKTNEIAGWQDGCLKIRIAAPPIEGRANEVLVRFLSEQLDLAQSLIEIERGQTGKKKRLTIQMAEEDVKTALGLN